MKSLGKPRREPASTRYLSFELAGLGSSISVGVLLMMSSNPYSQTTLPLVISILCRLWSNPPTTRYSLDRSLRIVG